MKVFNKPSYSNDSRVASRIVWVDYYKAIGIFLIVFGHAVFNNSDLSDFVFLFHVPLFFFISGYLEKTEYTPALEYLKKVLFSLVIPYFLWNIISVIFFLPQNIKGFICLFLGLTIWNFASWFLMILVFIKIIALLFKNKLYILGSLLLIAFGFLHFYGERLPYFAHITFMFCPFFFAGMYGKNIINNVVNAINGRIMLNLFLALFCLVLLFAIYKFTPIVHDHSVFKFLPQFYLFWISGFVGILFMFFICQCFGKKLNNLITLISSATLFIMCSHYQIINPVTKSLSQSYGDIASIAFVCAYFAIQCACIPFVLKYTSILAGRKRLHK